MADVPFVLDLIQHGAEEEHYDGLTRDFIDGALIPAINGQRTSKKRPTERGGSRMVTFQPSLWIAEAPQGTPVGFCLTKGPETPPTHPLYRMGEIWMLSINRPERGKGHGRRLLRAILEMSSDMPLFARCGPASTTMVAMLRAEGFQQGLVNNVIVMSRKGHPDPVETRRRRPRKRR